MKAYMSESRHTDLARWTAAGRWVVGPSVAHEYARLAEREARAILAEAESDNGHSDPVAWARIRDERPFPVGPVGTWGYERDGFDGAFWSRDSRSALAEALAAFVAS
jgi:hypothetical protein